MHPLEMNVSDERRQGEVSPFGTLENKNQWSATYKKIFDSFPQYDFLRSFQRSELGDRFEQPKESDSHYAQIRKTPSPIRYQNGAAVSINNGGESPGTSPRGILRKTPSPAPTYYSPPMYNNDRRDSNDTTLSLPHRKISFSSQSSPPLSILRRDSHDSSIRGKKRVSICEDRNNVSDGREAILKKVLENDVSSDLRKVISREFPENEDVDLKILCETHLPEVHSLERTGRLRSNDKKVYFNLQQNLCLGNSREAVGNRFFGPPRESANYNLPVKDTLICEDHHRYHSPPIMENAAGQKEYPQSVVYPAGTIGNQKRPICRLDSSTTTGSTTSASTSIMSELKNVHNLLQMKGTSEHREPVSMHDGKSEMLDCESPMQHTESRSWSRRRPNWDPTEPELISVVRHKVECGRQLYWADLLILKTFHLSTVHPMEMELFKLLLLDTEHPEDIEKLRDLLNQEYTAYQRILQNCSIHSSVYTSLAHSICLADSYWFHARIIDEYEERSRLYRKSIDTYSSLLSRAERTLSPEDISLIHVVEKISAILAESRNFDPDLILRASLLIDKAERRLDVGRETEARRRIERCKKNLAEINTYCHVPV